jgi:hypothetical protein
VTIITLFSCLIWIHLYYLFFQRCNENCKKKIIKICVTRRKKNKHFCSSIHHTLILTDTRVLRNSYLMCLPQEFNRNWYVYHSKIWFCFQKNQKNKMLGERLKFQFRFLFMIHSFVDFWYWLQKKLISILFSGEFGYNFNMYYARRKIVFETCNEKQQQQKTICCGFKFHFSKLHKKIVLFLLLFEELLKVF